MMMKFLLKGIGLWQENMGVEEAIAKAGAIAVAEATVVAEAAAAAEAAVALINT